ncbi:MULTISPECIES: SAM-dependent methyltransferase [unclassified Micromonospora]|uniref:SAM-dependent methyltransferase n=1 Tax=unclassified Micromonospora TaxID=2617518 RepID=UPI001C2480AD|nr:MULTISPECIES: SAM-dependent methyltransferase [unclassified Micromonospora]MBU8860600.1 SAM-dependent methyltransferase [Micromonospora sp. WMMB482]MDM4777882.1 SAM-dependent methyltransferase [Micromonospora sp. b486]MDM4780137.1 SAM-dependent methyltransferase [Micromonospora sp. b486]
MTSDAPGTAPDSGPLADRIDTSVAHPARRYNYWLGGKDNFQADRDSGDAMAERFPTIRISALENRRFLRRAVRHLAGEAGIRQFLDIGTGIPTADNTHEVAQSTDPRARVVYVDNDPIVLAHARALLTSSAEGATAYLDADLRDPERILAHPDLRRTLDLSQPVALMLLAVLHFVPDGDDPYAIVGRLLDALPAGSYLAASHATYDYLPPDVAAEAKAAARGGGPHGVINLRSREEVVRFFDGLEPVEPGVCSVAEWRADGEPEPRPSVVEVSMYGGVARKP